MTEKGGFWEEVLVLVTKTKCDWQFTSICWSGQPPPPWAMGSQTKALIQAEIPPEVQDGSIVTSGSRIPDSKLTNLTAVLYKNLVFGANNMT